MMPGQRLKVCIDKRLRYATDEIDALKYFKNFGEHLLATKVAAYRNGKVELRDIFEQIEETVNRIGDQVVFDER